MNTRVAVIGAGIAGLTAALALRKNNFEVDLFESTPRLGELGAGITLAPNAMRGLAYLGLADGIAEAGTEPTMQAISHWRDGHCLMEMPRADAREKYGAAYVYIHRADLQEHLIMAAHDTGVRLHLGKRLQSLSSVAGEVRLEFSDGTRAATELAVGADGLKSVVRGLFQPRPSQFTGHIAYRALAPVAPGIQHLIDLPGLHIGPGKMVVRYPLRKGALLNLVFFARQSGWTEDGWSIPAKLEDLRELYGDWCDDVGLLLDAANPGTLHKWAVNAHAPLQSWCQDDQVVLIGDAAHAMTPFLGQGAAMGIEDAVVFARAMAEVSDQGEALRRYEAARLSRASFVQKESSLNADRLQGPASELFGLGKLRNEETLGLFDYDCTSVPL
ncbi:MAG: FAD-dependent monooxygenase [Congregibacter sp.]